MRHKITGLIWYVLKSTVIAKQKRFEAVCKTAPALNIVFSLLICEIYGCFLICEICEICGLYCFCFSGLSGLGLMGYNDKSESGRFADYREYLYEKGGLDTEKGASIDEKIIARERSRKYKLTLVDSLRFRTRYFTDSGIIGTKPFVNSYYGMFKSNFGSDKTKKPKRVAGLDGVYSLKRLSNET